MLLGNEVIAPKLSTRSTIEVSQIKLDNIDSFLGNQYHFTYFDYQFLNEILIIIPKLSFHLSYLIPLLYSTI